MNMASNTGIPEKEITYINTEDGRTEVEWWEKAHFHGRVNVMATTDSAEDLITHRNLKVISRIPIPDDSILCDFCNAAIVEFPVPVVWNHALCKKCFGEIQR
jgi:hypothetical protein